MNQWLRRCVRVGLARLGLVGGLLLGAANGEGNLAIAQEPPSPAPEVGNCTGLAAEGVFEEITPP